MSTLLSFWALSFLGLAVLYVLGARRARFSPVSYEFDWHPFLGVTAAAARRGKAVQAAVSGAFQRSAHRIFHNLFHRLKAFHDRIFGKQALSGELTPSFFLKTIAEQKEKDESSKRREMGLF